MNTKSILALGKSFFSRKPATNTLSNVTEAQWSELSQTLFRQASEPKSAFLAYLDKFKTSGLDIPKDVQQALSILEIKATIFADRMDGAVARGTQPVFKNYYQDFKRINSEQFNIIENYLENLMKESYGSENWSKIAELHTGVSSCPRTIKGHHDIMYCGKITRTDKNVLGSNPIFYHGTKHQYSIARNGFRTKAKFSQRNYASRELGDAVYLTPDREVAAFYAGLHGGVLKTSVSELSSASVNNIQLSNMVCAIRKTLGTKVDLEQVVKELFKRNGYNAAYSRKGLAFGLFTERIDSIIGKAQSQLAVYTPENIAILPKTLAERIENTKLQFKAKYRMFKSFYNMLAESFSELREGLAYCIKKKLMPKPKIPKEIQKQIVSESEMKQFIKAKEMFTKGEISRKEFWKIKESLTEERIIKGSDWKTIDPTLELSREELNQYFKDGIIVNIYR